MTDHQDLNKEQLIGRIVGYSQHDCIDSAFEALQDLVDRHFEDVDIAPVVLGFSESVRGIDPDYANGILIHTNRLLAFHKKEGGNVKALRAALRADIKAAYKEYESKNQTVHGQIGPARTLMQTLRDVVLPIITPEVLRPAMKRMNLEADVSDMLKQYHFHAAIASIGEATKKVPQYKNKALLAPEKAVPLYMKVVDAALKSGKLGIAQEAIKQAIKLSKGSELSVDLKSTIVTRSLEVVDAAYDTDQVYLSADLALATVALSDAVSTAKESMGLGPEGLNSARDNVISSWAVAVEGMIDINTDRALKHVEIAQQREALQSIPSFVTAANALHRDVNGALDRVDQDVAAMVCTVEDFPAQMPKFG